MAEEIDQQIPDKRRLPWDEWTNGRAWRFVQGEDFEGEADEFRNRFYNAKKRRSDVVDVKTHKAFEVRGTGGKWVQLEGPHAQREYERARERGVPARQVLIAQFIRAPEDA